MPRSYVPEFRRRVVELHRAGRKVPEIASELGVSQASVYRWIAQDEIDHGRRPGLKSSESVELARARSRIRELEAELELTRQASALFAEGPGRPAPKGSTR